jgi:hypothetical protein
LLASGWTYPAKGEVIPPKILLKADSQDSPSEDFSNYLEEYFLDKKKIERV